MISLLADDYGVPLWMMQYEGRELTEDKRVIEIVKNSLECAYSNREFYGGRGLPRFPLSEACNIDGMYYENHYSTRAFSQFSGREVVKMMGVRELFYHNYSGKLLVPLK